MKNGLSIGPGLQVHALGGRHGRCRRAELTELGLAHLAEVLGDRAGRIALLTIQGLLDGHHLRAPSSSRGDAIAGEASARGCRATGLAMNRG